MDRWFYIQEPTGRRSITPPPHPSLPLRIHPSDSAPSDSPPQTPPPPPHPFL